MKKHDPETYILTLTCRELRRSTEYRDDEQPDPNYVTAHWSTPDHWQCNFTTKYRLGDEPKIGDTCRVTLEFGASE